jgi:hypothetical protein
MDPVADVLKAAHRQSPSHDWVFRGSLDLATSLRLKPWTGWQLLTCARCGTKIVAQVISPNTTWTVVWLDSRGNWHSIWTAASCDEILSRAIKEVMET